MHCMVLDQKTVAALYEARMKKDFPPDELRPLSMALAMMEKGTYECYGLEDGGEILAYAFFVRMGEHYLFDYFAVLESRRNGGIGSAFLQLLREKFAHAASVIGEVEDPDCAENPGDERLQRRRLGFYLRNGFVNTEVRSTVFGVNFLLIEMGMCGAVPREEIAETYLSLYRSFLPKQVFAKHISIKPQ